ncbi:hypothetical protein ACFLT7_03750 [candidate division KSB1 bacterium]
MRILTFVLVGAAALLLALPSAGAVDCETIPMPGDHRENGMWSALYAARNGMVYIGNQAHGAEAHFYQYNPSTNKVRHLADMSALKGERGRGIRIQAKIHTRFVEDRDGIIYFGTGNQGSGPWNIDPRSWEGGHWWSYDPETDEIKDLGLVTKGWGLYGLAYDRVRHRLYATALNGHIYMFDIASRHTTDLGRVNNWESCRTIVADDQGNCYGSFEKHRLFKYEAESGRLLDLPIEIPHDHYQHPLSPTRPRLDRKNLWRVAEWSDKDGVIYGIEGGSSYLFKYDPNKGEYGETEYIADMSAPVIRGTRSLPYATLSMTVGKDNRIYFMPGGSTFDYSSGEGMGGEIASFLVACDPYTKKVTDYGKLMDRKNGIRILGTNAAACGPDGTLYFFGACQEKDSRKAVGKVRGEEPFSLRLIICKPEVLVASR